jgi:hypothetical protein
MKSKIFIVAVALVLLCTPLLWAGSKEKEAPTIRILAFAQGFAWPELFGSSGTERTDLLKKLEEEIGCKIEIEWGDETAVRQKVLTDLILEPLDNYFKNHPSKYFDEKDVFDKYLDAN